LWFFDRGRSSIFIYGNRRCLWTIRIWGRVNRSRRFFRIWSGFRSRFWNWSRDWRLYDLRRLRLRNWYRFYYRGLNRVRSRPRSHGNTWLR
jgi:hypothetical protein